MTTAAWTLIFLTALSLWWPRLRVLSVALLGGGYLLAASEALLDWRAGIILVLLTSRASCCTTSHRGLAHTVEPVYGNRFRLET